MSLYGIDTLSLVSADELDSLVEGYLEQIHAGALPKAALIPELYFYNALTLLDDYRKGYEREFFSEDWTIKDTALLGRVQNNIFAFSAAKSFAQIQEMRDAVYRDGKLMPWSEYKKEALKINSKYNLTYLDAERQAVISAGTQGSRWIDIEQMKDTHPYLEYVTAADSHVREEHRALHGIILSIDDPFWQSYYPPNGYRCRCSTRKLTERTAAHARQQYKGEMPDSGTAQKMAGRSVDKMFRHNVGTTGVAFSDAHPYFKANADAKAMQLSAVKNYGMRPAKEIYTFPSRLAKYKGGITTQTEYNQYWTELEQKHGKVGEGFMLIDAKNNISATFDSTLKQKILDRGRHTYFDEAFEVFTKPSEVWGIFKGGKKTGIKQEYFNVYLKYYEDKPTVLLVNKEGRVDSFYKLDTIEQAEQFRMGLLKQKR